MQKLLLGFFQNQVLPVKVIVYVIILEKLVIIESLIYMPLDSIQMWCCGGCCLDAIMYSIWEMV